MEVLRKTKEGSGSTMPRGKVILVSSLPRLVVVIHLFTGSYSFYVSFNNKEQRWSIMRSGNQSLKHTYLLINASRPREPALEAV